MGRPEFPRAIVEFPDRFPDGGLPGVPIRLPMAGGVPPAGVRRRLVAGSWRSGWGGSARRAATRRRCRQARCCTPLHCGWPVTTCCAAPSWAGGEPVLLLDLWSWAAYLVSTGTPGISVLRLQRHLGLPGIDRVDDAAQAAPGLVSHERDQLTGPVEVYECFIRRQRGRSVRRREHGMASLVLVAVEVRGAGAIALPGLGGRLGTPVRLTAVGHPYLGQADRRGRRSDRQPASEKSLPGPAGREPTAA